MHDRTVAIPTQAGQMETFITHPEQGGPFPAVVIYWGLRAHSSPHFFDGIKELGDHGGGFEKNCGVSADGRFLRIHPDDSPAPR